MKQKSTLWTLLAILLVASLALAACSAPAATTEEPAVEEPAVEEPTAEEPTAEEPVVEEPVERSYKIGIMASSETVDRRENPGQAFLSSLVYTWNMTKLTVLSIVKMIEGVLSPKTLGGPILIAQMAGTQVREGFLPFLFFMAILSINLGVLNLLPIPVLDGGHLFFYGIELVTGKEVNIRWRERAQQVGFFILVLLMIFVFYNDIARIITPSE